MTGSTTQFDLSMEALDSCPDLSSLAILCGSDEQVWIHFATNLGGPVSVQDVAGLQETDIVEAMMWPSTMEGFPPSYTNHAPYAFTERAG